MDNQSALSVAYLSFISGLPSENTKAHYQRVLNNFASFLLKTKRISLLEACGIDIITWRVDLEQTGGVIGAVNTKGLKPNSANSVENKTNIISSFYNFLRKPGVDGSPPLIQTNPVEAIENRQVIESYGKAKKISVEVFAKISQLLEQDCSIVGLMNSALIWGYFLTGRRNSEWVNLRWNSLDLNPNKPCYNFTGKGRKSVSDSIPIELFIILKKYLVSRWGVDYSNNISGDTYIFSSLNDQYKSVGKKYVLRLVKKLAEEAGFSVKDICVHSLRHLHAETYLNNGANVETIRQRLKHATLTTTQKYISSFNKNSDVSDELLKKIDEV